MQARYETFLKYSSVESENLSVVTCFGNCSQDGTSQGISSGLQQELVKYFKRCTGVVSDFYFCDI